MKIRSLFILICLSLLVFSCTQNRSLTASLNDKDSSTRPLQVLCTTGMIENIVRAIAQEQAQVHVLIKEDLDPHSYELVKGDGEKFEVADLVFYNGLGLEHSPNIYKHLTTHAQSTAVGDYVLNKYPEKKIWVDGQVDPHIWMDVSLWKESIEPIVQSLSQKDPKNASLYQERGAALLQEMQKLHEDLLSMLHEIPESQRYLVTCHDAFNYFTKTYLALDSEQNNEAWRERCKAPEGLSPDSQLSMTDIQSVVAHLQKYDIQVVFPESNVNANSIAKIQEVSRKKGLKLLVSPYVLYADSLGKKGEGQESYLKMIRYNAEVITKCLKIKETYEKEVQQRSKS